MFGKFVIFSSNLGWLRHKKTVQYIVFDAIETFHPEATTPMGPRGMEITHSFIRQDN